MAFVESWNDDIRPDIGIITAPTFYRQIFRSLRYASAAKQDGG
jgi:hypothetical protein